ncbi:multidrug effflux MFS transporter [Staphylococcus epidermidis]|uniref:multidrug effflux MFS transporter n=1 Tax=Staphylococcus epidermidis TaxID=1282 RepID=UPI0007E3E8BB|nr:multidrug effflux MFS transporter [Staphylococcus epidermidis]MCO6319762.1 multidrug effflux MFS transporter [Staphylococcus epidermidis]OAW02400.1 Bcr/CflA family drug resistance efflux transporter [Staphylococcus epidermidis]CAG2144922.1 MFS family major facilitator transporter, teicoplanin:cation symporter [Staphylococcus epidermidis]
MKRVYQSENQSLLFIVILGSLTAFGPLAIDMFLPGLPNISHDFDISASTTQLTISFFMIGLALGNFLAGPISDITGRKKPLIFSLIIFTIASLGIIFVTNIWIMIILRFIQGLTGGAGAVISRAIASDMYSGNALTKFLSLLMLVNGIAPIIAPALGGIILNYGPWRIVFVILTMFGIVMLIGTLFKVPESLEKSLRESSNIGTMLINFKELFKTPRFVLLFTYISASPFIVQTIYGLTPLNFSIMFAFIGVTLIISSQLTGKLVDYIDRLLLLRIMSTIQVIGVIIVSLTLLNHWTFWILSCGFVILVAPVTGIATLGFSIAMDESKGAKGSSSSLLGLFQTLLGGVISPLVGIKGDSNAIPYIIVIVITAIILMVLQLINVKIFKKAKIH